MAINDTITCTAKRWTQLTQSDVAALRAENQGAYGLKLQATSNAMEPTSIDGCIQLGPGRLLAADLTVDQLWPGVAGAVRVWAYNAHGVDIHVSVSHA